MWDTCSRIMAMFGPEKNQKSKKNTNVISPLSRPYNYLCGRWMNAQGAQLTNTMQSFFPFDIVNFPIRHESWSYSGGRPKPWRTRKGNSVLQLKSPNSYICGLIVIVYRISLLYLPRKRRRPRNCAPMGLLELQQLDGAPIFHTPQWTVLSFFFTMNCQWTAAMNGACRVQSLCNERIW
jgi:hypothetical protein